MTIIVRSHYRRVCGCRYILLLLVARVMRSFLSRRGQIGVESGRYGQRLSLFLLCGIGDFGGRLIDGWMD